MTKLLITVRQAKEQCRIDISGDDQDVLGGNHPDNTYLSGLIKAGIIAFENTTNRKLYTGEVLPEDAPNEALLINELIQQGILMLISHWYENRVAIDSVGTEVPYSFTYIAEPYRWFHL